MPILHPLRNLPGTMEILGLGRVRENPNGGLEPQIEVLCQPDIFNKSRPPAPLIRWLGVGQMALLASGNRFVNGLKRKDAPAATFSAQLYPAEKTDREKLGDGTFANTATKISTKLIENSNGWLLHVDDNSASNEDRPYVVFLPQTELIRALFGSSSDMLKQLFDGRRDPAVAPSRFRLYREQCSVDDAGRVTLTISRKIADQDVHILAAFFADQSEALMRTHDMVHQNLSTDPAYRTTTGAFLQTSWPWQDGVQMTVSGRWLHRFSGAGGAAHRFVVTKITEISFPSPPTAIVALYPNETKSDKSLPPPQGRKISSSVAPKAIRSDRAPDSGRKQDTLEVPGTTFPFSTEMKIDWTPAEVHLGRKDTSLRGDPVDGEHFLATDDPRSGGDPATGHAKLIGERNGKEAPPDRESSEARQKTWKAVERVAKQNAWSVDYWKQEGRQITPWPYRIENNGNDAPLVATLATPSGLKAIADIGSGSEVPASLGAVSNTTRSSPRTLAVDVFRLATASDWKWLGKQNRIARDRFTEVVGHLRVKRCWEDELFYAEKIEEWLA